MMSGEVCEPSSMKRSIGAARARMARAASLLFAGATTTEMRESSNRSWAQRGSTSQPTIERAAGKYRDQISSEPPFCTPTSTSDTGRSR